MLFLLQQCQKLRALEMADVANDPDSRLRLYYDIIVSI